MHITEKGQVTIPIGLREAYGFLPHTEVEFIPRGKELVVRKTASTRRGKKTRGELLVAHLRSFEPYLTMSADEVMALTRGED